MRRTLQQFGLVATLAVLATTGAACKKTTRLEGRWRGTRVDGNSPVLRPVYQQLVQYVTEVGVTARGNLLTVESPQRRAQTAEFTVKDDQQGKLVIVVGGNREENFTVDQNTLRWLVAEETYIVFQREKP